MRTLRKRLMMLALLAAFGIGVVPTFVPTASAAVQYYPRHHWRWHHHHGFYFYWR